MNSLQAKSLAKWYQAEGIDSEYLMGFIDRMQDIPDEKEGKIMRWLGFIQGTLWAQGVFSVEELKQHSRLAVAGSTLSPAALPDRVEIGKIPDEPLEEIIYRPAMSKCYVPREYAEALRALLAKAYGIKQ